MDARNFNPEQMEIKRQLEMIVATSRRFVVHRSQTIEPTFCSECGGATLTAEQTALMFQITQRAIFQFIEQGAAHFNETEKGAVMICLPALSLILRMNENPEIPTDTNKA